MVFREAVLRLREEPAVGQPEVLRRDACVDVCGIAVSDADAPVAVSDDARSSGWNVSSRNITCERSRNHARRCESADLARVDWSTRSDEPAAIGSDVADFGNHPPGKLVLNGQVPLLRVRSHEITLREETEPAQRRAARTVEHRSSVCQKRRQPWDYSDCRQWKSGIGQDARERILRCH